MDDSSLKNSKNNVAKVRIDVLRELLGEDMLSTQDELVKALKKKKFNVTQSTISRDLRRLGAVRAVDQSGQTVYRLPDEVHFVESVTNKGLRDLLKDIEHNGSMIVIHTSPGSASLLARHLDVVKPGGILGTLAGDDTIFVAPNSLKNLDATVKAILDEL